MHIQQISLALACLTAVSVVNRVSCMCWCVAFIFLWHLSDGISYIQCTIVKNSTKTMEIIIDFFFI